MVAVAIDDISSLLAIIPSITHSSSSTVNHICIAIHAVSNFAVLCYICVGISS